MFSKNERPDLPADLPAALRPKAPPSAARPSLISSDMTIEGDVECQGELQVDGTINGDIRARKVVAGETATVNGVLRADVAELRGHIKGTIEAQTVAVFSGARIEGDIVHGSLSVEAGAFLDGVCRRLDKRPREEVKRSDGNATGPTNVKRIDESLDVRA